MFKKKHYLYLDESEYNVLVRSLVELKNRLIRAERFTDCVDQLQPQHSAGRNDGGEKAFWQVVWNHSLPRLSILCSRRSNTGNCSPNWCRVGQTLVG